MDGTRISHYELQRLLGRGGMGEVYQALDLNTHRAVALKFLAPELAAEPIALKRFQSEAVHAASLNHPNIATLYAFDPDSERPFIAMELVTGESLRARIERGALPIGEALAIARDVAVALAYAHRRGIVHRDIKPENLMFDEEGRVKIMDFGLARALRGSRLTMTAAQLGTPAYMSPESLQGNAGQPADVWALGLVLIEMVTGETVFTGDSPFSVMFAIANVDPPPLRERRPDVPEPVERLARRMIERSPEQRPDALAVARELAELTGAGLRFDASPDLGPAAEASGGTATAAARETTPREATPSASSATTLETAEAAARIGRAHGGRRRATLAVGGAILVLGIAGGLRMLRSAAGRARQQAVVFNNRGYAALRSGRLDEAERLVDAALSRDPRYGEALFNRAVLYDRRDQLDSAAALYDQIVRTHPHEARLKAEALYNLGDIDLRGNAPLQAAQHLGQSFAVDSSRWEGYNNYGYALTRAGRPGDAVAVLLRGIARFPGAAPLYKNAALAYLATDQDREALAYLDRALDRDHALLSALGARARVRARLGDRAGALADWKRYVEARPAPDPDEASAIRQELADRGVAVGKGGASGP